MIYDDTAIDRHFAKVNQPKATAGPAPSPQQPAPAVPVVGQQGSLSGDGDPLMVNRYAGPNGDGKTPLDNMDSNPFQGRKPT
jgi:hypothetical protein